MGGKRETFHVYHKEQSCSKLVKKTKVWTTCSKSDFWNNSLSLTRILFKKIVQFYSKVRAD